MGLYADAQKNGLKKSFLLHSGRYSPVNRRAKSDVSSFVLPAYRNGLVLCR